MKFFSSSEIFVDKDRLKDVSFILLWSFRRRCKVSFLCQSIIAEGTVRDYTIPFM
jgi:hypothetical protein